MTESQNGQTAPLSERDVIRTIIKKGNPARRGIAPFVRALCWARLHGWKELELEQYLKLAALLDRTDCAVDDKAVERLLSEINCKDLGQNTITVTHVIIGMLTHVAPDGARFKQYMSRFDQRLNNSASAWRTRSLLGELLHKLNHVSPEIAERKRSEVTSRVPQWSVDYEAEDLSGDFETISTGMFTTLRSAAWSDNPSHNVERNLHEAITRSLDKLMTASDQDWFPGFVQNVATHVSRAEMCHRLPGQVLFDISEMLSRHVRRIRSMRPTIAKIMTNLEEAIHRPHRLQLDRVSRKMELELPGKLGFGDGPRLRVHDISRDGCLAVLDGPADFEQTDQPQVLKLNRGPDRTYMVNRLTGIVKNGNGSFGVKPEMSLLFHGTNDTDDEYVAVDNASVVRCTNEKGGNRLWLGFYFDRMVPEVREKIEDMVYNAA